MEWREENGVIYFSFTSDGTTGEEWLERFGTFRVSNSAVIVLRSKDFIPTSDVTINIAVMMGELFTTDDRITKKIREEAARMTFSTPNAEVACLMVKNMVSGDLIRMGLGRIIITHNPIYISPSKPRLLMIADSCNGLWLDAYLGDPESRYQMSTGFAFTVSSTAT
ncbi:hypothetical protein HY771_00685 [Candidatus Uhrbacteria bacterium]|nr:hypothetical protein [Candidatus Uhrbacteria bacterium]